MRVKNSLRLLILLIMLPQSLRGEENIVSSDRFIGEISTPFSREIPWPTLSAGYDNFYFAPFFFGLRGGASVGAIPIANQYKVSMHALFSLNFGVKLWRLLFGYRLSVQFVKYDVLVLGDEKNTEGYYDRLGYLEYKSTLLYHTVFTGFEIMENINVLCGTGFSISNRPSYQETIDERWQTNEAYTSWWAKQSGRSRQEYADLISRYQLFLGVAIYKSF